MSDRAALLAAVLAAPDDDTPRLVYANYLEETGDPVDVARAHFIRLEIESELRAMCDPNRERLETEAARLFNCFGISWNRELPEWATWPDSQVIYRRGFVEEVHLTFRRFARDGGAVFAVAPVRAVRVRSRIQSVAADLLGQLGRQPLWPNMSRVTAVQLGPGANWLWGGDETRGGGLCGLFASYPSLTRLRRLVLSGNELNDEAVQRLCQQLPSAVFGDSLQELDLSDNRITDAGGCFLGTARGLDRLTHLNLSGNRIGDAATMVLRNRFGDRVVL